MARILPTVVMFMWFEYHCSPRRPIQIDADVVREVSTYSILSGAKYAAAALVELQQKYAGKKLPMSGGAQDDI